MTGTIVKGIGGFYYISSEDGIVYECKARGIFRKNGMTPLIGDRVLISVSDRVQRKGTIDKIEDRSTVLIRPAVANINQMVAVIAAKSPEPDLLLLDKLLVTAAKKEIKSIICINKTDLDSEGRRNELRRAYDTAGYCVIETSHVAGSGLEELDSILKGSISVFAGQSGVGKSTLLNRVMNTMVMKTGSLSDKIERGRHTTRHAELVELEGGGFVVDTPGFSSFEISGIGHQELQYMYPEFEEHIVYCRFIGCSHMSEPDCGVKKAVGENRVDAGRYGRYAELYTILKQADEMKYKNK